MRLFIWIAGLAELGVSACAATAQQRVRPVIVRAADQADVAFGVGGAATLTPPAQENFAQMRLIEHAGYRTPLHVHHKTDETFVVLQGEMTVFVDGARTTLRQGEYVFLPRGTPHAQGNLTDEDAVILMTLAPAAFAEFFSARAQLVQETPPDHPDYGARMRALGQRFDIEIVGPTPF